tara:strand:- start:547 stop:1557 length:1011 start_codon:yes stop_codon:yes gene_type:complete
MTIRLDAGNLTQTRSDLGLAIGTDVLAPNGSAANLTAIPAAQITGTLPAVNGGSITDLNASNLGSGTVPDARFPATLPATSGVNLTALPATLPAASGVNLTALNATNLGTGSVPDARLPANLQSFPAPGSDGNVLTAASGAWTSAAAAGGGSWELLHVTEVSSAVATVDIGAIGNTPFDDGFEIYCITIDGFRNSTSNTELQCLIGFDDSAGSVAYFTSGYFQHLQRTQSNHNGYLNTQGITADIQLGNNISSSTRNRSQFVTYWSGMGPSNATYNTIVHGNYCVAKHGDASLATGTLAGFHDGVGSLPTISLRFQSSSGNIENGNFRVYGLKETI